MSDEEVLWKEMKNERFENVFIQGRRFKNDGLCIYVKCRSKVIVAEVKPL